MVSRSVRWSYIPVAVVAILLVLAVGMTQLIPVESSAFSSGVATFIMIVSVLVFIGTLTAFFMGLLTADESGAFDDKH